MDLSKDSQLLVEKAKPMISLLGWIILFATMVFSAKQGMSLMTGFLLVLSIRGGYSIIAYGMLSILITSKEKEWKKA